MEPCIGVERKTCLINKVVSMIDHMIANAQERRVVILYIYFEKYIKIYSRVAVFF